MYGKKQYETYSNLRGLHIARTVSAGYRAVQTAEDFLAGTDSVTAYICEQKR